MTRHPTVKFMLVALICCRFTFPVGNEVASAYGTTSQDAKGLDGPNEPGAMPVSNKVDDAEMQLSKGMKYESDGDFVSAKKWYLLAARRGNDIAAYHLASICFNGLEGISQPDYQCAVKWFSQAASHGSREAQYKLGFIYLNGFGVKEDISLAKHWYELAASNGYARAQSELGDYYHAGSKFRRDGRLSNYWYEKAAAQGMVAAQRSLGLQYMEGKDVKRNYFKALKWLLISKKGGLEIDDLVMNCLENNLTKVQVKRAREITQHWPKKGTEDEVSLKALVISRQLAIRLTEQCAKGEKEKKGSPF